MAMTANASMGGSLHDRIQKGINWLIRNQNSDGGWGIHGSVDSNVGATAYACRVFRLVVSQQSQLTGALRSGIQWLRAQQNSGGGWGARKGMPSNSFCTSELLRTSVSVSEFSLASPKKIAELLLAWQNIDGGWGLMPNTPSNIHDTCHVAFSLLTSNQWGIQGRERPLNWIAAMQRPDGGWALEQELSSPSLTTHAAEIIRYLGPEKFWETLRKAIEFLKSSQQADGGWTTANPEYHATFFTPLTIAQCGAPQDCNTYLKGISWVINSQLEDGSWPSERLSGKGDTLFTAIAIETLCAIESRDFSGFHM